MKIVLFQPRYPYGKSQVYLPGGLMNLGSRLIQAGVGVSFFDLNLIEIDSDAVITDLINTDEIGFSVLGPPYIDTVVGYIKWLRRHNFLQPILIGGEGVARLRPNDFKKWFSGLGEVVQARGDEEIKRNLGLSALQSPFDTSMVSMLKWLTEESRRQYLTAEFALFLSDGCGFNCGFCAALKDTKEKYRTTASLRDELEYICRYLKSVGHSELKVYLSNLDALQTVVELEERLKDIWSAALTFGITLHIRCLATSKYMFLACRRDPKLPARLYRYGVRIIAFGVDGADEETWKREHKTHNVLAEIETVTAIVLSVGITVELLMVIGLQKDRPLALLRHLLFSFRKAFQGAVIRPYLGKSMTPSGRWPKETGYIPKKGEIVTQETEVQAFLDDASLLTRLDYAMLGSKETHPNWSERWLSNLVYLLTIFMLAPFGLCRTRPLIPVPKKGIGKWMASLINRLMPFDR